MPLISITSSTGLGETDIFVCVVGKSPVTIIGKSVENSLVQFANVICTLYTPGVVMANVGLVAFGITAPSLNHWLPADALDMSVTVSVFNPLAVMVGLAGVAFTVTAEIRADDCPHTLLAVTAMLPLLELAVAIIEVVVDVPVHPLGNVQV